MKQDETLRSDVLIHVLGAYGLTQEQSALFTEGLESYRELAKKDEQTARAIVSYFNGLAKGAAIAKAAKA